MYFDWGRFEIEKIAVHCKTEHEYEDFIREADSRGFVWFSGDRLVDLDEYGIYAKTLLGVKEGRIVFGDEESYKERGYGFLEWSDFMDAEQVPIGLSCEEMGQGSIRLRQRLDELTKENMALRDKNDELSWDTCALSQDKSILVEALRLLAGGSR